MAEQNWRNLFKQYETPHVKKSIWQLVNTLIPFFSLWYGAYACLSISYGITLLLAVIAGGFLVRAFIIFHDCCHKAFFKSRIANEIVGIFTGLLAFFPYHKWAMEHNIHHATNANLDKRGVGDIWTLTVEEYIEVPWYKKLFYRLYRNPILMFGVGPALVFLFQNRFNRKRARIKERLNTYFTNITLTIIIAFLCWQMGWESFLLVQIPIFLVSGAIGVWLFYIQHTFENSYNERDIDWTFDRASIMGSSYYKLPSILQWMTGNIGFHHIHHLNSKIPNYNLGRVYESNPYFQQTETVTLFKSLQSLRMKLWDEKNKKFIHFKDVPKWLKSIQP